MNQLKDYLHIPVIIATSWLLAFTFHKIFNAFIDSRKKILNIEPTNYYFLRNGISFAIYLTALALIFKRTPSLSELGTTIFASAGILAAAVGFASKEAISNIVCGIFIVVFKPFRVGDFLEFDALQKGTVEDITLRHTVIQDINNKRLIIPNSIISANAVTNVDISDRRILYHYKVSVAYEADIDLALKLIVDYLNSREEVIDGRSEEEKNDEKPIVKAFVSELGESGVLLRADYWAEDYRKAIDISRLLNKEILQLFKDNNIEIPYPHRTIIQKS